MPTPPQQMLEIIPMRRGRPTRHVKSSSGTQIEPEKTAPAATAAASFDPFDPAHVNASSKSEKLDFDPNSIFSLNEKSLADANFQAARSDQEKVEARKSLLAFESDFDPSKFTNNNNSSSSQRSSFTPRYESPPMVSAVPSGQNSSSVTGSDHSDDNTAKDKEDDDRPKIRNLVASDIESRIQSLQMHATAATATTTAADADIIGPPKPSRSTPSSQQQQKYKPTPPPKPARFRLSNVVAPVLEPTSSSTTSNIIPNNNKDDRRPSLTDFEEKFPPIDDLYKKLPVDLQSKWFKRNKLFNIRWKMMGLLCLCGQGYHARCKVKLQRAHSNSPRAVTDWWLSLKKKRWEMKPSCRKKKEKWHFSRPRPFPTCQRNVWHFSNYSSGSEGHGMSRSVWESGSITASRPGNSSTKVATCSWLLKQLHCLMKDAAGIVTCGPKGRLFQCKGNGMVRDVFDEKQLSRLVGSLGVGHGK